MQDLKNEAIQLTEELADSGLIIEGGFAGFKLMVYPSGIPNEEQARELRNTFFAGAQHLYQSIFSMLDVGVEPTAQDMERLSLIGVELERFIHNFELGCLKTEGSA